MIRNLLLLLITLTPPAFTIAAEVKDDPRMQPLPCAVTAEEKAWWRYTPECLNILDKANPVPFERLDNDTVKAILDAQPELQAYMKAQVTRWPRKQSTFIDQDQNITALYYDDPVSALPDGDDGWFKLSIRAEPRDPAPNQKTAIRTTYGAKIRGSDKIVRLQNEGLWCYDEGTYKSYKYKARGSVVPDEDDLNYIETLIEAKPIKLGEILSACPSVIFLNISMRKVEFTVTKTVGQRVGIQETFRGVPLFAIGGFLTKSGVICMPQLEWGKIEIKAATNARNDFAEQVTTAKSHGNALEMPRYLDMTKAIVLIADEVKTAKAAAAKWDSPTNYTFANIRTYMERLTRTSFVYTRLHDMATASASDEKDGGSITSYGPDGAKHVDKVTKKNNDVRKYLDEQMAMLGSVVTELTKTRRNFMTRDAELTRQTFRLQEQIKSVMEGKAPLLASAATLQADLMILPSDDLLPTGYLSNGKDDPGAFTKRLDQMRLAQLKIRQYYANSITSVEVKQTYVLQGAYEQLVMNRADFKPGTKEYIDMTAKIEDAKARLKDAADKHPLPPIPPELAGDYTLINSKVSLNGGGDTYRSVAQSTGVDVSK